MRDISMIDSNFKVKTDISKPDVCFYDIKSAPFGLHGVFYENGKFRRLPEQVARSVSEGVTALHAHTAGGRVRFCTDSPYIAIHAEMPSIVKEPHFALTGSAGFDLYVTEPGETADKYAGTFTPPFFIENGYESVIRLGLSRMREITINMPLYSEVSVLYVGLAETATVCPPSPYQIKKPIVYYGSSITQGGCAARPGCAYQSMVSRKLRADYWNLGFSGNAIAEKEIADYIAGLEMSAFVFDYDYNASTAHLQRTHERMFLTVRDRQPALPILLMSRPKYSLNEDEQARLAIIRTTYENAIARGDTNVYVLDGKALMRMAGDEGTVDGCHPTDLGFASMAHAVTGVLEKVLR